MSGHLNLFFTLSFSSVLYFHNLLINKVYKCFFITFYLTREKIIESLLDKQCTLWVKQKSVKLLKTLIPSRVTEYGH